MQRHWAPLQQTVTHLVMWKDLLTGTWEGPDVLITSGRGYACVFPQTAETPIWIPDRLIRPLPPENLYQNPEAKEGKRSHEENEEA